MERRIPNYFKAIVVVVICSLMFTALPLMTIHAENETSITVFAKGDPTKLGKSYEFDSGEIIYGNGTDSLEMSTSSTFQDVIDEITGGGKLPDLSSVVGATFTGWKFEVSVDGTVLEDSQLSGSMSDIMPYPYSSVRVKCIPEFDKNIVGLSVYDGYYYTYKNYFVANGTSYQEFLDANEPAAASVEGFAFLAWVARNASDSSQKINSDMEFNLLPRYKEGVPVYVEMTDENGDVSKFFIAVDRGTSVKDAVSKAASLKGYENAELTRRGPGLAGCNQTINDYNRESILNNTIDLEGHSIAITAKDKAVTVTETKVNEAIDEINEIIANIEANPALEAVTQTVTIDMKNDDGTVATVAPVAALEAVKGKNIDVVLDMGEYSWIINGSEITAETLEAINLEVILDSTNIPDAAVKEIAGDKPIKQISLTHNGEFGFKAKLTLNIGAEYKGQYGNLYWYDANGNMQFMNAGLIDENGNASLTFTHASDYVIVIGEEVKASVATGDSAHIELYIILGAAAVCVMGVAIARKKKLTNA